ELGAFARASGMRISGPNCLGLANVKHDIWATSSSRGASGVTGPIGLVCQSGATAFGPFLVRAVENGIGFSYIISTGNEADLDFTDFARYLGVPFDNQRLFAPFTTTLVEIRLDRDAYPLDLAQISNLFGWDQLEDIGNASPQPK